MTMELLDRMTTEADRAAQPTLELVVARRTQVSPRIVALELATGDGSPLPAWEPGAHVTVHLPGGLDRQYSLCGDPDDVGTYRIAILREDDGRGGSIAMHGLAEGDRIDVTLPRNTFPLEDAATYLLVAGGIGVTPLIPMAWRLAREGKDFRVVFAVRNAADAELARMLPDAAELDLRISGDGDRVDLPGLLTALPVGTAVYACGPSRMLDEVASWNFELRRRGGAVHVERFEASAETLAGIHVAGDTAFTVTFARSGDSVTVGATDTIMECARRLGKVVASSCEEGYCGTCETDVVSGTPDHRDDFLSDDERASGETMMICVSRSAGDDLVLDL
jgi:ferredoxin-NADP reductase